MCEIINTNKNNYNRYTLAYFKHMDYVNGQQFNLLDAERWRNKKHKEFQVLNGISGNRPYSDVEREMFVFYLNEVEINV